MAESKVAHGQQFLDDLSAMVAKALDEALGLDADTAQAVGDRVAADVCACWGKTLVYIQAGRIGKAQAFRKRLFAEFNGRNHR